jgi:Tol biopolymer transport system component
LSRAATALLWFQPLLWLLARRIEETAEDVCDNYVIEHAGDRRGYAQQLVALAEQLQFSPAESLAGTGVIAFRSALGQRVVRILDGSRNLSRRVNLSAAAGVVAAGLAASASVGLIGVKAAEGLPTEGVTTRILVADTGEVGSGMLSPDETKVAFVDYGDANRHGNVMVKTLATGAVQNITNAGSAANDYDYPDQAMVWSRDSTEIAYAWYRNKDAIEKTELRISTVATGTVRILKSQNEELEFYPLDWSSDGRNLLCTLKRKDRSQALALLAVDSGEVRQVLSLEWNPANDARLSPDGRFIAFDRTIDGNQDIYVLDIEGHQLSRLTNSPRSESGPVWSADGKILLFSSDRRGTWDLWGVRVAGGTPTGSPFVMKLDFGDHSKRMTGTGRLAFNTFFGEIDGYYVEVAPTGKTHLSAPKLITRSFMGRNAHPTWSPDGTKVAQVRDRRFLVVQNLTTGREDVFDPGMRYINSLSWSPDEKWIAVSPGGPKAFGVHAFNLDTLELRTLFDQQVDLGGKFFIHAGWSEDGAEFIVRSPRSGPIRHVAIGLNDRKIREIKFADSSLSPNGRYRTYNRAEGLHIAAVDRSWDEIVDVGSGQLRGTSSRPEWSRDGTKLAMTISGARHAEIGVLGNLQPPKAEPVRTDGVSIQEEISGPNGSISDQKLGLAATLPPGWKIRNANRSNNGVSHIAFLAPGTPETQALLHYDATPSGEFAAFARLGYTATAGPRPTTPAEVEGWMLRLAQHLSASGSGTFRAGSFTARKVGGHPAWSWVADHTVGRELWTEYMVAIESGKNGARFQLRAPAADFENLRRAFDTMIESFRIP